ncbi:MAG: YceI family protein [Saprospiraceae bacterium]|nr:YceI family protein [Saprospiraceae bacterium]
MVIWQRTVFILVTAFVMLGFRYFSMLPEVWVINSTSSLKVDGTTNINSFTCQVLSYGKSDTIIYQNRSKQFGDIKMKGVMRIDVNNFDCKHKVMTKDLRKTLKSEEFPHMNINLITFSKLPSEAISSHDITGSVQIELAGKIQNYQVQYELKVLNKDNVQLIGTRTVLFSEFGIKPPSKLGGTIKVRDQLQVEFKLMLKKIS